MYAAMLLLRNEQLDRRGKNLFFCEYSGTASSIDNEGHATGRQEFNTTQANPSSRSKSKQENMGGGGIRIIVWKKKGMMHRQITEITLSKISEARACRQWRVLGSNKKNRY